MHASTSNIEKKICGNVDDVISNLQIPKFPPPPELSLKNIHSQTTIGNSVGEGNFVPPYHASAYSTPPPQAPSIPYDPMPNSAFGSSLRHTYVSPNQPSPVSYSSPQPNQISNGPRAEFEGFREEMLGMFRQTFGIDPKEKKRAYQKLYPEGYEYVQFPQGV
jgi:hypothetical protein